MKQKLSKKERLSSHREDTFKFYETPRHGYLLVPNDLVVDLDLRYYISPFSFQTTIDKKKWLYLEEDSDASTFIKAYSSYFNNEPNIDWVETDDETKIIYNLRYDNEYFMVREMIGTNTRDRLYRNLQNLSKKHLVESN